MSIQLPIIVRRDGIVTASGIHVVPDPIRSIETPSGPIIMSSAVIGRELPIAIPIGMRIAEVSRIGAESVMFIGRDESDRGGIEGIAGIESVTRVPAEESCACRGIFIALTGRFRATVDFFLPGLVCFFFFEAGFLLATLSFMPLIPGID